MFSAGRGDEGVDLGEGVWGHNVDGLELVREGRVGGGSVRDVRVKGFGGRGKAPRKAGEDHNEEHETFESCVSLEILQVGSGLHCNASRTEVRQGPRDCPQKK